MPKTESEVVHCKSCDEDGHICERMGDAPTIEFDKSGAPVAKEPLETPFPFVKKGD